MVSARHSVVRLVVLAACAAGITAQSVNEMLVRDYEKKRKDELIATGQRHVDLGWSIKDKGLIAQATWQFVRAVELSEGTHQGAAMVLNIVRTYEDAFWKKRRKKPQKGALAAYEKRAAAIDREDQKGQIDLARAAQKAKLNGRLTEHLLAALRLGAEVEFGPKGAKIGGLSLDAEFATWLQEQTVERKDGKRRFEPAGQRAPRVPDVTEVEDDRLVVRTDLPGDAAARLHALGSALLPHLEQRLDGAPVRPLGLFVFRRRADYDAYLDACGHGAAKGGAGLCDYGTFQTLVCAEGLGADDLHALVLHELSHLFFFGTSPVAMPDWYAEGFAESFGGQGTFTWDGKLLAIGGPMRADRLAPVVEEPMPLAELLVADAAALLAQDHERGMRFYAQCWALQRYLSTTDNPWRARFEAWEDKCRGALPGSQSTSRLGDKGPAAQAFTAEFGDDLARLEADFRAWLARQ